MRQILVGYVSLRAELVGLSCQRIFPEFSSFFLDPLWVKLTKLNHIAGLILAIVTLCTASRKDGLSIASAAVAILSTMISFRLNRVKRNNLKNRGLCGINTRIFLAALYLHFAGSILSYLSWIFLAEDALNVLTLLYHICAIILAIIVYLYQSATLCCCRDQGLLRTTVVNQLERQSEAFVNSKDGLTMITELTLVHVLNQIDKVDRESLSPEDRATLNKVKERVSSADLTADLSSSTQERFERLRRESMSVSSDASV